MASSAEEQSITPVPFRYRRDWLQGLVRNLIHLVLRLQVQQAGALPNVVAAVIYNPQETEDSSSYTQGILKPSFNTFLREARSKQSLAPRSLEVTRKFPRNIPIV